MATKRKDVTKEDRWNVEALFPAIQDWENEFKKTISSEKRPHWPELKHFQGKLSESTATLKKALETILKIDRKLTALYTYAHLKHDEEITDNTNKVLYSKIYAILHDFAEEISWFEPEILTLPTSIINEPSLAEYKFYLEKILRMKEHTLSQESESLLALAGKALGSTHKAFSAINDADFKFGSVLNAKGEPKELTHAQYGMYLRDQDRVLRKNTFTSYLGKYFNYENTLCELLNGQVQTHLFNARARKYQSCVEAALYPKNIDLSVYHALVGAVSDNMEAHHKYINLRKKILGVDELHLYDIYVPLTPNVDIKMTYDEAVNATIESTAPLGTEYQNFLRKGLIDERWVDRYENENKRSGAYSSGCYDSCPIS